MDALEQRTFLSAAKPELIDMKAPAPVTSPVRIGDTLYYLTQNGNGRDLWSSSPKNSEAQQLGQNIYRFNASSVYERLYVAHDTLYAIVRDPDTSRPTLLRFDSRGQPEKLIESATDAGITEVVSTGEKLYVFVETDRSRNRAFPDYALSGENSDPSPNVNVLVIASASAVPVATGSFTSISGLGGGFMYPSFLFDNQEIGEYFSAGEDGLFFTKITNVSFGTTRSKIDTWTQTLFYVDESTQQVIELDSTFTQSDFLGNSSGSYFSGLGVLGDHFYYLAGDRLFSRSEAVPSAGLWRTDGTPEGTTLVAANLQGLTIDTSTVVRAGDRLFFIAEGADGRSLYSTDGTAEGTGKVLLKAAGRAAIPASRLNASVTRTIQLLDGKPVLPVQVGRAVQFWNITATTQQGGTLAATVTVVATLPSGSSLVEYTTNNDQLAFTTQRGDFRQAFLAEAGFSRPLTPPTLIRGVPSASPSTDTLTLTDDTVFLDFTGIDANPIPTALGLIAVRFAKPSISITNIQTPRTAFAALGFPISYTLKNTGSDLAVAPDAARRVERIYLSTDRKLDPADRLLASLDSAHPTGSPAIVPAVSQVPAAIDMPSVPAGSAAVQTIPAHFVAAETADAGAVGQRYLIIVSEAYSSTFTGTLASTSQAVRPIRILPRNEPNLVLTLLGGPPPSAKPGDTVNLRLQFSNFGTSLFSTQRVGRPLNIDFDLVINQSRYDAGTTSLDLTLKPGEFKALDVPFRIPDSANPQNYNLWITLDPDNILALTRDGRETSRSGSISIT